MNHTILMIHILNKLTQEYESLNVILNAVIWVFPNLSAFWGKYVHILFETPKCVDL